jgi:hypothetical protein
MAALLVTGLAAEVGDRESFEVLRAGSRDRNWADNPPPPYDLPPMQVPTQREGKDL